jgi:hypothetical protein
MFPVAHAWLSTSISTCERAKVQRSATVQAAVARLRRRHHPKAI